MQAAAVVAQTEWNTQPPEQQYPSHLPLGAFPPEHGTTPYTAPPGLLGGARSGWIDGLKSQQQQQQQEPPPPSSATGSTLLGPRPTNQQGVGTLLIGRAGRSKFLGPTAGSEWLNDVSRGSPSSAPSSSKRVVHIAKLILPAGLRHSKKRGAMKPMHLGCHRQR
jgi:hypothetical protein